MNSDKEYWRIFKFSSLDEMSKFDESLKQLKPKEEPKLEPKEEVKEVKIENRGSKTKELHKTIKEYIKKHPEAKYRDVLKNYKNIV